MTVGQVERQTDAIREIAERHGATNIRVFGSHARGEARVDSDLDLLIDLRPGADLIDLIAIQQDLEDLLGITVDAVTPRALSPYIGDRVLSEARPL